MGVLTRTIQKGREPMPGSLSATMNHGKAKPKHDTEMSAKGVLGHGAHAKVGQDQVSKKLKSIVGHS